MALNYVNHENISLQESSDFSEVWLHDRIAENPAILGLGQLDVLDRERTQHKAGRLDMLLYDADRNCRFEVEIMLGATDPSHIVRCIEYWDIERRRYPAYDHVAVLVAEDVTSRFLSFMSLLSGSIPLIAIQLNALRVGDSIVLNFAKVLDQTALREDDITNPGGEGVNREYWDGRVGEKIMSVCDRVLEMINEKADSPQQFSYRKAYLGLTDGISTRNFIYFSPRKSYVHLSVSLNEREEWLGRLEEAGLPATPRRSSIVRTTITPEQFEAHKDLIRKLVYTAVENHQA